MSFAIITDLTTNVDWSEINQATLDTLFMLGFMGLIQYTNWYPCWSDFYSYKQQGRYCKINGFIIYGLLSMSYVQFSLLSH